LLLARRAADFAPTLTTRGLASVSDSVVSDFQLIFSLANSSGEIDAAGAFGSAMGRRIPLGGGRMGLPCASRGYQDLL
jgi:hypothetical protein